MTAPDMLPRDWMQRAACRDVEDPDVFFPDPTDLEGQAEAQRICFTCPVIEQCDVRRITVDASHGVWAGDFLNRRTGFRTHSLKYVCGTMAAYRRHRRNNEPICNPCERAASVHNAERRNTRAQRATTANGRTA